MIQKSETLTNVNGGNIKVLGVKHVTFITGKVIIHVNFLIVEDIKNPIIGLDAIHHNRLQVHLHEKGVTSASFFSISAQTTSSLSSKSLLCVRFGSSRSCSKSSSSWSDPQFTTLDNQSASNITAEIDDKVISDSRKIILEEESQEDISQQSQVPQCLKVPSTPSAAERELHELTHFPSGHGARFVSEQKDFMVSTSISLRRNQVIQLDDSFYKVQWCRSDILKVLTFIGASTSMCGAVIRPFIANQVGVKALKQFIMVNGFTHSVLQCDGHSGLMKLQDQVGKDLSLPTQISPPNSHQSQGTVERFHNLRLFVVKSGQSNLDSLLILEFILTQQQLVS